uniref:T-complex protein 1 subunit alpha n=1 Tax=Sus scrofa TaxID=9823 RepID=A0A8D1UUB1_PIG
MFLHLRQDMKVFMREQCLHNFVITLIATILSTLANLEGEETFEASMLGQAEEVVQERICDDELILIKNTKARTSASIILRGANDFMCDEMERSLHDALCVVRRVLESKSVVPGGGAVEAALSIYLENYATSMVRTSRCAFSSRKARGSSLAFRKHEYACLRPELLLCVLIFFCEDVSLFVFLGLPGTACYCRVCKISSCHS